MQPSKSNTFSTKTHTLAFPSDFYRIRENNNKIAFKVIYPEISPFKKELKERFYKPNGTHGDDVVWVRLFEYQPLTNLSAYENEIINDRGRYLQRKFFAFPHRIKQLELLPTDPVGSSKYIGPSYKGKQAVYFIKSKNDRITSIKCIITPFCEGTTTWRGKISISYRFNIKHLKNIQDLDEKIHDLVLTLKPQQMEIE